MNIKLCSRQYEGRDRAGRTLQRTADRPGTKQRSETVNTQTWRQHNPADVIAKIRHRNIMDILNPVPPATPEFEPSS